MLHENLLFTSAPEMAKVKNKIELLFAPFPQLSSVSRFESQLKKKVFCQIVVMKGAKELESKNKI